MPTIKTLENRIYQIEGFDVHFMQSGRNMRGDKTLSANYRYQNSARGDWTVSEWRAKRFESCFPGYDVAVLDGNGNNVTGQLKLSNLRSSY